MKLAQSILFVFSVLASLTLAQTPAPSTPKPSHAPTFIIKPPTQPSGGKPTHAPTFIIKPPTPPSGPTQPARPPQPSGPSQPHGPTHVNPYQSCMMIVKSECNCALVEKGSPCPRQVARMYWNANLSTGNISKSTFVKKIMHKTKAWCRRISPNGRGNP